MLNSLTAQPITHVLLFDGDAPQHLRELGENTRRISDCYRRLLLEDSDSVMESNYRVVFAVPEASSLAASSQDMSSELKAHGIYSCVVEVKAADIRMWQGKVGLLSCVLWCIAGTVLLNEVPISENQAEKLLVKANQLDHTAHHLVLLKQGWFQQEFRLGLVRSGASIGYLLRGALNRFPNRHSVSDILRVMKANCSGHDLFIVR